MTTERDNNQLLCNALFTVQPITYFHINNADLELSFYTLACIVLHVLYVPAPLYIKQYILYQD